MDTKSGLLDNTPVRIDTAALTQSLHGTSFATGRTTNYSVCNGEVLAGRYKVMSALGCGGTGTVYKVEQIFLHHYYALKLLSAPLVLSNAEARFHKEAQACHHLNHPNLIKVHDFDLLNDNRPFLVMDLCEGPTLAEILKTNGSLPVERALDLFIQICDGLACAHENGVVHRDLKPNNIIVTNADGQEMVKIVDFGIAKILHGETIDAMALTRTGEIFGTPLYMSPEQCLSKPVDHRSDVYSAGCALFETLTGVPPFMAENTLTTMMKHQSEMPATLRESSLGKQFPSDLERVVFKLLAKDPDHRYQSITEAREHLISIRGNQPIEWDSPQVKTAPKAKLNAPVALSALFFGIGFGTILMFFLLAHRLITHTDINPKIQTGCPEYELLPTAPSVSTIAKFSDVGIKNCKGPWILHFPKQSIGRISPVYPRFARYMIGWTGTPGCEAAGDLKFRVPLPLAFKPAWPGIDPRLLRRFRSDELAVLNLQGDTDIDDDSLVFIGQLSGLNALNLAGDVDITNRAFEFIQRLPNLVALDISWTQIDGAGLSKYSGLSKLTYLCANHVQGINKAMPNLEQAKLTELRLQGDNITEQDLERISHMDSMQYLYLAENPGVTDAGIATLSRLKNLIYLDVRDCSLTKAFVSSIRKMPSLRTISLSCCNDDLLKALAKADALENASFDNSEKVTDEGVRSLAAMTCLKHLSIRETSATPRVIADLKKLPHLEVLEIPSTWFNENTTRTLKEQLPNCKIQSN